MTSPKLQFIVLCEQAFLTVGSNNLNIIGIFSQINAAKFPFSYPRFSLVVNFDAQESGKHIMQTEIVDPTGKQIARTELPVTISAGNTQVIATFEHMQFATPGQYSINVMLDDRPFGQRLIQIRPVSRPAGKANLA